jgi:hypothetical protein
LNVFDDEIDAALQLCKPPKCRHHWRARA